MWKLRPCDCGSKAQLIDKSYTCDTMAGGISYVECFDVGCTNSGCEFALGVGGSYDTIFEATEKWNNYDAIFEGTKHRIIERMCNGGATLGKSTH